jgi:hypothetical protein
MKTDCHGNSQSWATAKCCPSVTMAAVSARHGSGQMLAISDGYLNNSMSWHYRHHCIGRAGISSEVPVVITHTVIFIQVISARHDLMVEHIGIDFIPIAVIMVRGIHVLPGVDPVLFSGGLNQIGKEFLRVVRMLDVRDIKIHHGLVRGGAVDGSRAYDFLPEAAGQGNIRDPVKPHLIIGGIEKALFDKKPVFIKRVDREAPRKTKKIPFSVMP